MMNKLNPIYILLLIVTLSIVSFIVVNSKQNEFNRSVHTLYEMKSLAKKYKELKSNWDNRRNSQLEIEQLINDNIFKDSTIKKNQRGKTIEIEIESDNPDVLVQFLSKILNMKIFVNKLEINPNSISVEVGL